MDLITPICWQRGECLGVDPNCHGLRRKRLVGQGLDVSVPYGGGFNSTQELHCGDDACERCMAFVTARTQSLEARRLGCDHTHLRYAGVLQPLIVPAAAVSRMLPIHREQCKVLGITHDNALGLLMWRLQIPMDTHFSACMNLWGPNVRVGSIMYQIARNPEDMNTTHQVYMQRYNMSDTHEYRVAVRRDTVELWTFLRHKLRHCFHSHAVRNPLLSKISSNGFFVDGGVQATRYWSRTSPGDREAGEPFRFEDCANYPDDRSNSSRQNGQVVKWMSRPPNPIYHKNEVAVASMADSL
jgi:hypothetical protein